MESPIPYQLPTYRAAMDSRMRNDFMHSRTWFAVGLVLLVAGCQPPATSQTASAPQVETSESVAATQLVSLQVDGMTCPTGCYPIVRSAIAKQKGVVDVELAPQKEKDVIDNPIVMVKVQGDVDWDATLQAISRAGFDATKLSN